MGQSRSVRIIRSIIETAAADVSPVLLEGEQGVGKALAARWIHATSRRGNRPFMRVVCSGKTDIALDAELFGAEGSEDGEVPVQRGALELAQGGTVLLEEVECMGQLLQERLAGVMTAGRFCRQGGARPMALDVRFMAASCHDLELRVADESFDADLFRQFQGTALHIPPLRERREDILPLIFHFIDQYNKEFGRQVVGLSKLVERLLMEYPWPGNVREARNVMERAVILGGAELLYLEHLPLELFAKAAPVSPATFTCRLPSAGVDIEEVEKELIRQALDVSNNNQSKAARKLGLGIDAFRYRMKKHGFLK
jgi:DNA-binding NtrC family response regulator